MRSYGNNKPDWQLEAVEQIIAAILNEMERTDCDSFKQDFAAYLQIISDQGPDPDPDKLFEPLAQSRLAQDLRSKLSEESNRLLEDLQLVHFINQYIEQSDAISSVLPPAVPVSGAAAPAPSAASAPSAAVAAPAPAAEGASRRAATEGGLFAARKEGGDGTGAGVKKGFLL